MKQILATIRLDTNIDPTTLQGVFQLERNDTVLQMLADRTTMIWCTYCKGSESMKAW